MEKTFAIIKPDAVESKNAGRILTRIEAEGFRVVALKRHRISKAEAESFYGEHSAKSHSRQRKLEHGERQFYFKKGSGLKAQA